MLLYKKTSRYNEQFPYLQRTPLPLVFQATLGYSQQQLGYVAVAKDIGNNVGLLAGYLFSILPPWANLLIGATQVGPTIDSISGCGNVWSAV